MKQEEFRRHKRHKVKDGALVVLEPYFALIGKIVDISHGGLSFHYKGNNKTIKNPCEVSFIFGNTNDNKKSGPFKFITNIISDEKINDNELNNSNDIKCCRMKFKDLSYYQKLWVEECISNYKANTLAC